MLLPSMKIVLFRKQTSPSDSFFPNFCFLILISFWIVVEDSSFPPG